MDAIFDFQLGQAECPPDAVLDATSGVCRCAPGFREDPTSSSLRCVAQPYPLTQSPKGKGGTGKLVGVLLLVAIAAGLAAAALGAQPGDLGDFAEAF